MVGMVVTTWNVENFSSTAQNFEQKLRYLAAELEALEPDVIALQEVLDETAAARLAASSDYHLTLGVRDGRGIRVAFLTRDPPVSHEALSEWRLPPGVLVPSLDAAGHVVNLARSPRPALKMTLRRRTDDTVIDFINVHLKSKLLDFPGGRFNPKDETERASVAHLALGRRAAEATTVRTTVSELLAAGRQVIVLGDLNDGPQAATTEILYGPIGSQPEGPEDAAQAGSAFNREDAGEGTRLFNATLLVPA